MKNRKRRKIRKHIKLIIRKTNLNRQDATNLYYSRRPIRIEKEKTGPVTIISGKKLRYQSLLKRLELEKTQLQERFASVDVVFE
jgi:hypothetical protein